MAISWVVSSDQAVAFHAPSAAHGAQFTPLAPSKCVARAQLHAIACICRELVDGHELVGQARCWSRADRCPSRSRSH